MSDDVSRYTGPREVAPQREGHRDDGVQVRAGERSQRKDHGHHRQARRRDLGGATDLAVAELVHGHGTRRAQDQQERPEGFRKESLRMQDALRSRVRSEPVRHAGFLTRSVAFTNGPRRGTALTPAGIEIVRRSRCRPRRPGAVLGCLRGVDAAEHRGHVHDPTTRLQLRRDEQRCAGVRGRDLDHRRRRAGS